jgi:dipeptidase
LAYFHTGYPHWSIIKEIDLSRPDYFMASKNYKQVAIDLGWYDPKSDEPLESSFFKEQTSLDAKALELYKKDPDQAKRFLTRYTNEKMEQIVEMYRSLRKLLITKYTNNKQGI